MPIRNRHTITKRRIGKLDDNKPSNPTAQRPRGKMRVGGNKSPTFPTINPPSRPPNPLKINNQPKTRTPPFKMLTNGMSSTTRIGSPRLAIPAETKRAITIGFDFTKCNPSNHPCHKDFHAAAAALVVSAISEEGASRFDCSGDHVMKAIMTAATKKDTLSKNIMPVNPHNPNKATPMAGPMSKAMLLLIALRELAAIKCCSDTSCGSSALSSGEKNWAITASTKETR